MIIIIFLDQKNNFYFYEIFTKELKIIKNNHFLYKIVSFDQFLPR